MVSLVAFWRARKSSQHHKTFQINSSLGCQNAFPLPSTPARDCRDPLWNGLIVQGIKDFYGSISGCAVNCEFQIQTAQDPRPWAASAAEALCCFTRLKLADMSYVGRTFAQSLCDCSLETMQSQVTQDLHVSGQWSSPFFNFSPHFQNCHICTFWWDLWYVQNGLWDTSACNVVICERIFDR